MTDFKHGHKTPYTQSQNCRALLLFCVKKNWWKSKISFHSRRDISATFTGNPSQSASMIKLFESLRHQVHQTSSYSGVSKTCKLDMLSPVECYIKSKENELKLKTEEVMEKKRELETITDQIKIVNILSRKVHVKLNFKCLMTNHAMSDTQLEHVLASRVQT